MTGDGKSAEQDSSIEKLRKALEDRKQAEQALARSEERYRELFENANDVVYTHDLEGNFTSLNRAAEKVMGYTREEALELNIAQVVTPDDLATAMEMMQRKISDGSTTTYEIRVVAKDGRELILEVSTRLVYENEKPVGVQGIGRDVTERTRREQLRTQLMQTEKLSSLGQLVSGVAHELNNPMTGILGFAQLLLRRSDLTPEIRKGLEEIEQEADRTRRIVKNLLTFARQRKPQKSKVQINDILRQVLELRAYEMRVNNIDVIERLERPLPEIWADAHQLQQVFMNILINGEHAMLEARGRGKLEVVTEWDAQRQTVKVSLTNDGPPIVDEDIARIFDPFFTTKPVGKGTGLGLSISYGIIEEHGGRMAVESLEPKGVTFTVDLPMGQGMKQLRRLTPESTPTPVPAESKRVLVIDDEPAVANLVRAALETEGHQVDIAYNGLTGLEKIGDEGLDAVICDLKMPGNSGMDIYRHCKKSRPELARRFLVLTGDMMSEQTLDLLTDGSIPVVAKPFDIQELLSTFYQLFENPESE